MKSAFYCLVLGALWQASETVKPTLNFNINKELHPDAGLSIHNFTEKYGYPLEDHTVQTEDGYILTLHRIPHGVNDSSDTLRPPVLIMHGILSTSMDWVNLGPGKALALLLADAGFDVWLGNQRGNTWSRKHAEIDPDLESARFYNFTWHEIGIYDLPAKIDYVLNATNQPQLSYIGHSQGTTEFFVLMAEKPEYNEKIRLMSALSPIVFMGALTSPLVRWAADQLDIVTATLELLKIDEFLPNLEAFELLSDILCVDQPEEQNLCLWLLNIVAGIDWNIDSDFATVIYTNFPAGASVKQLINYLQEVNSQNFCRFDYGPEGNLLEYGQETPPYYDIQKITAPISLHYANNDWLASIEDVSIFANLLKNLASSREVPNESFNHVDFLWAKNVDEDLYSAVVSEHLQINGL